MNDQGKLGAVYKPLIGTVAVVLLAIFALRGCHVTPGPKIPEATQHAIDSLAATKPAFQRATDSIIRIVVHDTVRAATVNRAAEQDVRLATQAEQAADSLARVAAAHSDSAALWHSAYLARTQEAEALRRAVAEKDSAFQAERDARRRLMVVYASDTLRRVAIEKVNADLQKAINGLEQPCRIAGPVPCPSRTVVAVTTAVTAAIAGFAAHR